MLVSLARSHLFLSATYTRSVSPGVALDESIFPQITERFAFDMPIRLAVSVESIRRSGPRNPTSESNRNSRTSQSWPFQTRFYFFTLPGPRQASSSRSTMASDRNLTACRICTARHQGAPLSQTTKLTYSKAEPYRTADPTEPFR